MCTDKNAWLTRLWNGDELPTDNELKQADHDPISAVFRFILMRGIREDPRKEPKDLVQSVDKKEILDKWKECMNPNVPIRVCATCGKRWLKVMVITHGNQQGVALKFLK